MVDVTCPWAPTCRPVPPVTARTNCRAVELAGPSARTVPRRSSKSASHSASWAKLNVQERTAAPAGFVSFRSTYSVRAMRALSPATRPLLPGVGARGCRKYVVAERVRLVPSVTVVGVVDELVPASPWRKENDCRAPSPWPPEPRSPRRRRLPPAAAADDPRLISAVRSR